MIGQARSLLAMIAEEVTNRDNKTCLLLPRKNFGREIDEVFDCVRDVALSGGDKEEFKKNMDRVSRSLRTVRADSRTYFVGQGGLVFKSPGKAGARHGLAPVWEDPDHEIVLCNPRANAIRRILRPEISLRLRRHGSQRSVFPQLPRHKDSASRKDSREHRTERQHQVKVMSRDLVAAHWDYRCLS